MVKEGRIEIRQEHNHEPNERQSQRLEARKAVLDAAKQSSHESKEAFDAVTRDHPGGELVSYGHMYR